MVFFNSLQVMLTFTILGTIGYILAWKGWIARDVEIFIPRFITKIAIPPFLMIAVVDHFEHDALGRVLVECAIPFVSIVLVFFLFLALGRVLRIDKKHLGLAATSAATSNTIFIGLPVNQALFGDPGMPPLLLYFLANTVFFWTIGNYAIAREGVHEGNRLSRKELLSRIFSPPFMGTIAGMILLFLQIPLPGFVRSTCTMLGAVASPLALVYVGVILRRIEWKRTHMGWDVFWAMVGRVVLTPIVTIGVIHFFPLELPALTSQVYIVQAGLPSMTNIALLSAYYGADREFGSVFVCLSSVVGMATVPIWMTALNYLM